MNYSILNNRLFLILALPLFLGFHSCCSKKKVVTPVIEDDKVIISPAGGEYTFPEGIILKVPAGAVDKDTAIDLRYVDSLEVYPFLYRAGVSPDGLLACVEGFPDGMEFQSSVQLILPVDLDPGEIPVVYSINLEDGSYWPEETEIVCKPEEGTIAVSLRHFSSTAVKKLDAYEGLSEECQNTPCRCIQYKVEQRDVDYLCSDGNCQIAETKLKVSFPACDNASPEEFFLREVGEGCVPKLQLSVTSQVVPPGGQTNVTARVMLDCEPRHGQSVDFSLSGSVPAFVDPTYGTTNDAGETFAVFTAGDEEGSVTLTARSTVSYYQDIIYASAGGMQEIGRGPLKTKSLNQGVTILIEDATISGTVSMDAVMYMEEGMVWDFDYSNPLPFMVSENDSINGGGYLACMLYEIFGGGGIDLFVEGTANLSGWLENDTLYFDSPEYTDGSGYVDMWAYDQGGRVSVLEIDYDDPETTLSVMGIFIMDHTATEDTGSDDRFAFKLPKEDGAETQLTFVEDGTEVILTFRLDLE